MESIASELFEDILSNHNYSVYNNSNEEFGKINGKKCLETTKNLDIKKEIIFENKNKINEDFSEVDIQNSIEISEGFNENGKDNFDGTAVKLKHMSNRKNEIIGIKKERYFNTDVETISSYNEDRDRFCSFTTDDSGIESSNSVFMENEKSFIKSTTALPNVIIGVKSVIADDCINTRNQDKNNLIKNYTSNYRESNYVYSSEKDSEMDTESHSEFNNAVTMQYAENFKDYNQVSKKKYFISRKSREVFVSEESPIIEGEFEQCRRVTRLLVKNNIPIPAKHIESTPGKLVWGYFRSGWWPG
jgi:hypothetical protein